jgi:hypothetical protein
MRTSLSVALGLFVFGFGTLPAWAQTIVKAQAVAVGPGSVAVSNVQGQGQVDLNSIATASHGGLAVSNLSGVGINGGLVQGTSFAGSVGGQAFADTRLLANGPACVQGSNHAASEFGTARSILVGQAEGCARLSQNSTTLAQAGGVALTEHAGLAQGLNGGAAIVRSEALSHSYGPYASTQMQVQAVGAFGGVAQVQAAGAAIGMQAPGLTIIDASGRAVLGGRSQLVVTGFNLGR